MSTRIIVKGIPPWCKAKDLRETFGDIFTLTDAKVILKQDGRSRCFGFLGFTSSDDAADACERFNGAFIGTSRISCEIARTIKEQDPNSIDEILETGKSDGSEKELEEANGGGEDNEEVTEGNVEENPDSGRLFIRNLHFDIDEEELGALFSRFGDLSEIHIPVTKGTLKPYGIAFVEYSFPNNALTALEALDGTDYKGRILHIIHGKPKKVRTGGFLTKEEKEKLSPYQQQREEERKKKASWSKNWNSLFVRQDTALEAVSREMGVGKEDILSKDANNLATRVAYSEAHVIDEAKRFLEQRGVSTDALIESINNGDVKRSRTVILVKNLGLDVQRSELRTLFAPFGSIDRVILSNMKTIAIVEFSSGNQAKTAFKALAYTKFKGGNPLYLEWAPVGVFKKSKSKTSAGEDDSRDVVADLSRTMDESGDEEADDDDDEQIGRREQRPSTLTVKNLPFQASRTELRELFANFGKVKSVRLPKKFDGTSRGFGFVEFFSHQEAARVKKRLTGTHFYGRRLVLQFENPKPGLYDGDKESNEEGGRKRKR